MISRGYHWRSGNRFELLVDGAQFMPAMLTVIAEAQQSLLLEFYMVSSGQVADAFISKLIEAVERGVQVCWLVDDFGGRGLSVKDTQRLTDAGIDLRRYNPLSPLKLLNNFARDHRKLLIADQQIAFIGGTGISDEYLIGYQQSADKLAWHEVMVRVEGPVITDLSTLFATEWVKCGEESVDIQTRQPEYPQGGMARVSYTDGVRFQGIKRSFVTHVNHARDRVWLATAYFLPSFSVRRSLRQAARRGVDVRIIVAGPCTDHPWVYHASKRYYRRLLKAGVKIYEYQPSFLHTKLGLCDSWVSVGSCNLDHWNLRWNLEANLEIVEPDMSKQVEQLLESDMLRSQEIDYQQWKLRPLKQRFKEALWSMLCQLLLKIR